MESRVDNKVLKGTLVVARLIRLTVRASHRGRSSVTNLPRAISERFRDKSTPSEGR